MAGPGASLTTVDKVQKWGKRQLVGTGQILQGTNKDSRVQQALTRSAQVGVIGGGTGLVAAGTTRKDKNRGNNGVVAALGTGASVWNGHWGRTALGVLGGGAAGGLMGGNIGGGMATGSALGGVSSVYRQTAGSRKVAGEWLENLGGEKGVNFDPGEYYGMSF